MSRKPNNRPEKFFSAVITLLCVCAAGLMLALFVQSNMNDRSGGVVPVVADHSGATPEPLTVVSIDSQITPTPDPLTGTPAPSATQEPFEYLPVYNRADTRERAIAITLDDCSYYDAYKYAAKAAAHYGAKLTLTPIGNYLLSEQNMQALQYCVFNLGFQVENRTLNNSTLYGLDDFSMAKEIWAADLAVDYALNKDYSMHLLRTKGGQGLDDPRTHAYLKQLGYDGFLTWTYSGADNTLEQLKSTLEPGNIYLFNCTKDDVVKLAQFMKFAQSRGYAMVTVNELLGFEENACVDAPADLMSRTMPELADYTEPLALYSEGDRSNAVYRLQVMLKNLGYLTAAEDGTPAYADGVYGEATIDAVERAQAAYGLPCTGIATIETQQRIRREHDQRFGENE